MKAKGTRRNGPLKGPSLPLNTSKGKPAGLNVTARKPS